MPALLLLDTAAAAAQGWTGEGAIGKLGWLSAPMLLVGVVLSLVPMVRRRAGVHAARCWALSLSLGVALLASEWMLRQIRPRPAFHTRKPGVVYHYDPDPYVMPGTQGPATTTINSLGLRGPEPTTEGTPSIVCIGGDSTECCYLPQEAAWPARLQQAASKELRRPVWCAGAGHGDYGSGFHEAFLRQSPLAKSADVVVLLVGANDYVRTLLNLPSAPPGSPPLWARSNLLDLLREIWCVRFEEGIVFDETGRLLTIRRLFYPFPPRSIDWDSAFREYRGRLAAIIDVCRRNGSAVVLAGQPVLWSEALSIDAKKKLRLARQFPDAREWDELEPSRCLARMNGFYSAAASVAGQHRVGFIDPRTDFNGRDAYFIDDFRLSAAGCEVLAHRLAPAVGAAIASRHKAPERTP